jgi:toxin ParE1/3/4
LIFYRVLNDTVEVLHVLHGARDYEAILFPNE